MKKILLLPPILLALTLFGGCSSIIPKKVEFFQDKVKAVPTYSISALEVQRQAAKEIAISTAAASDAAIAENSTTNVTTPLKDAKVVAGSLSTSLGPPESLYGGTPVSLAARLDKNTAKLQANIADYAKDTQKNVGKKIEGSGLFQIGYFSYVGILLLLGALIWFGVRVYGMFNPVVGTAAGAVGRVSSSVLSKGFSELVSGGQTFLQWVDSSNLEGGVKDWISNTFKLAHQTAQSPDVQLTVDKLTETPTSSAAPLAPAPSPKAPA